MPASLPRCLLSCRTENREHKIGQLSTAESTARETRGDETPTAAHTAKLRSLSPQISSCRRESHSSVTAPLDRHTRPAALSHRPPLQHHGNPQRQHNDARPHAVHTRQQSSEQQAVCVTQQPHTRGPSRAQRGHNKQRPTHHLPNPQQPWRSCPTTPLHHTAAPHRPV